MSPTSVQFVPTNEQREANKMPSLVKVKPEPSSKEYIYNIIKQDRCSQRKNNERFYV